jgi:phosphoenolpyruvate-protein kinase (PTS system EI component)
MTREIPDLIDSLVQDQELQKQFKENWDKLNATDKQALHNSIDAQYKELAEWTERLAEWLEERNKD